MNQPRRFKEEPVLGREGRLMALGSLEVPAPEVKQDVARRLGISATVLASAAAATAVAPSAAAATFSSASVGSLSAAFGKVTGSFIATTLAKATVIGLGLGIASYTGVRLIRSRLPANNPPLTAASTVAPRRPERAAENHGVAVSALQDRGAETVNTVARAAASDNPGATVVAIEHTVSSDSLAPAAASVGRFEDVEPHTASPSIASTSTESLTGQDPEGNAAAATRAGAMPADPRLAREVRSLDLARSCANHGDAAGALKELNGFDRNYGYIALQKEAMLVHIDVLLSLGHRVQAAAIARQLLLAGAPATRRASLEALVLGQP